MPEFTYESIAPILERAEVRGGVLHCVFACPVSDLHIESRAAIGHRAPAAQPTPAGLLGRVRNGVVQGLRGLVGFGVLTAVGPVAVASAMARLREADATDETEEQRRDAAVQAFRSVASQFTWEGGRWIAIGASIAPTDFARQLAAAPIAERYDRQVLARMLLEVASADGHISQEERAFLEAFLTPEVGPLDDLVQRPCLSHAELAATTAGVRETSLMIAWALALVDRELDVAEREQLQAHAHGLGIAPERAQELKLFAQRYIVDEALTRAALAGAADEAALREAMDVAAHIGLPEAEAIAVSRSHGRRNAPAVTS